MLKIKYRELVKHTPTVKIIGIGVVSRCKRIVTRTSNISTIVLFARQKGVYDLLKHYTGRFTDVGLCGLLGQ